MKRIISLLIAVLMLCALCVPAFAETPDEYVALAEQFRSEKKYEEAIEAYKSAILGYLDVNDLSSIGECNINIVALREELLNSKTPDEFFEQAQQYQREKQYEKAIDAYNYAIEGYTNAKAWSKYVECYFHVVEIYNKLGYITSVTDTVRAFADTNNYYNAEEYKESGDLVSAADAYMIAGYGYLKVGDRSSAVECFGKAAELYDELGYEDDAETAREAIEEAQNSVSAPTASTLSEGNMTVVVGVAGIAVGFLAAMFIFKKKKPALAEDSEN